MKPDRGRPRSLSCLPGLLHQLWILRAVHYMRPPSSWRRRSWSSKSETRGLGSEGRRCGRALPVAALVAVSVLSMLLIFVWPARKRPFSGAFFGTTPPASGSVNEAGVSRKEDVAGVLRELEVVSDLLHKTGVRLPLAGRQL